ncbi:MAG: chloride channel protein [Solirubrobacterales bacterium]|nr:chloride channel protein [Solirubrobacterales bacterium]
MTNFQSPQPNVTGLGIVASYSARFWGTVGFLGAVAGLGSAGFVALLRAVEHLTYGVKAPTLYAAALGAPSWRRVVGLVVAALIVMAGLALLGKRTTGGTEVSEGIWLRSGWLDWPRSLARGVLSIVIVGMGVSLGREAAPQLFGAASGSRVAEWGDFPTWQRRLLVACGAGAGFASVYNVPLGGALMALEVLLGTLALPLVLPALLCSVTATAVAWIFLGDRPLYAVPSFGFHPSQLVFAVVAGPLIGLLAVAWTRLIRWANHARPAGRGRWIAPLGAFMALALLSLQYPELLGNGRSIVQLSLGLKLSLGLLCLLLVLKPVVTAACVASGAPGGLFTPTLALGILFAAVCGSLFGHIYPGADPVSYELIGGGAFLAAAMQGPISGTVLVLELTRRLDPLMVPTVLAVVAATVVARRLGAASIYSARMPGAALDSTSPGAAVVAMYALDESLPADLGETRPDCR